MVYIKLSTFFMSKNAVSPCISSLSYVFHKIEVFLELFFHPHYPHFLKTLDFTGFVGNFFSFSFFDISCAIIWDELMDRIFHPALYERKEHNGKYNTS